MSQANMSGKTANMTATAVVRPLVLDPDRRTMIISDIHGNLPFLKGLLRKVGYTKDDVLIILGDILEKSVHGLETLHYLMELSRTNTVYFVQGNCEDVTLSFLRGSWPDEVCLRYGSMWGDKCAWVSMAHQVGMEIQDPKHYPAIRAAIEKRFPEELEFLRAMPQILVNDDYLLVHGGVPQETDLEHLNAHNCMKNDNFLNQGYAFRRWVVVGHWPVSLYHRHVPTSRPLLLPDRHIASIDGGCTLKADGQLNALILPARPGGAFRYVAYDGFPVMRAQADQEASDNSINIRWGHSLLEVLRKGEEFSLCRHIETGRELDILTEFLRQGPEGTYCLDTTDYELPVSAGQRLAIIRQTTRGALAKKDGATGWYRGDLKAL